MQNSLYKFLDCCFSKQIIWIITRLKVLRYLEKVMEAFSDDMAKDI